MSESEEVKVRKRRSSQEIRRLVAEFEASGLRLVEFCNDHSLALSTLHRGLKRRRKEVVGQGLIGVWAWTSDQDLRGPRPKSELRA